MTTINITKDAVRTVSSNDLVITQHFLDRLVERGLDQDDVLKAAHTGKLVAGTPSVHGSTLRACLGQLVVVFGKNPSYKNKVMLVTAFFDDNKTGLTGGVNPNAVRRTAYVG